MEASIETKHDCGNRDKGKEFITTYQGVQIIFFLVNKEKEEQI